MLRRPDLDNPLPIVSKSVLFGDLEVNQWYLVNGELCLCILFHVKAGTSAVHRKEFRTVPTGGHIHVTPVNIFEKHKIEYADVEITARRA